MYCDTPQVNQLTALLEAHHIRHIVVCPGSRNATIAHNLNEKGENCFTLHPVTDERSAAFVAIGLILATQECTAVCVTSGSALINCIPAVAEAYYRHLPLLIISADRPQNWIGQLDGQTLPQSGALLPYCPTYTLRNDVNAENEWFNNRSINEAILSLYREGGCPAHINVPIAEPMFCFTTEQLPHERKISFYEPASDVPIPPHVIDLIAQAQLPALIIGQYERGDIRHEVERIDRDEQLLVLPEVIADVKGSFRMNAFDALQSDEAITPDVVIQIGGNFIHKRFKALLRSTNCKVIRISPSPLIADTFCHLDAHVMASPAKALAQLSIALPRNKQGIAQAKALLDHKWNEQKDLLIAHSRTHFDMHHVLCTLKQSLVQYEQSYTLHLGNSTTVRVAGQIFEGGEAPIFCNRGTNGIEGSLSTAVGYAIGMWGLSICIIGDLSFFYDCNALWNTQLPNNLRILLLNNHHGGIFDHLPGLSQSPARDSFIAAGHQSFTAQGIAEAYHLNYFKATEANSLTSALHEWLKPSSSAQLLEVELPQ